MWECGLKPSLNKSNIEDVMSLLMWECGLKPYKISESSPQTRHSLCGSVD